MYIGDGFQPQNKADALAALYQYGGELTPPVEIPILKLGDYGAAVSNTLGAPFPAQIVEFLSGVVVTKTALALVKPMPYIGENQSIYSIWAMALHLSAANAVTLFNLCGQNGVALKPVDVNLGLTPDQQPPLARWILFVTQ